jgi:hypothetical protein
MRLVPLTILCLFSLGVGAIALPALTIAYDSDLDKAYEKFCNYTTRKRKVKGEKRECGKKCLA